MAWPLTVDQSIFLYMINYNFADNYTNDLATIPENDLLYLTNKESVHKQNSNPVYMGHWKTSLFSTQDQEDSTLYLRQEDFNKAAAIANVEDDDDNVDDKLIFRNAQDAYI
jgi:hypothetical protein